MASFDMKAIEQAILNDAASILEANKAEIEAVAGPVVLSAVNGAIKIADGVFAQLPFGMGGLLDAALAKYVALYEGDLSQYEGQGIDALVALLKKIAQSL